MTHYHMVDAMRGEGSLGYKLVLNLFNVETIFKLEFFLLRKTCTFLN